MSDAVQQVFADPRRYQNFIDGAFVDASDGATIERESPAHSRVVSIYAAATKDDTDVAISAARCSFDSGNWAYAYAGDRAAVLRAVAQKIRDNVEELALVETLESSKPIGVSRGEVMFAAELWDYAAGQARGLHGDSHNNLGPDMMGMVLREPIGVVGIITPWNFPLLILSERLPFALGAGCSVVVKPSEFTSGTSLMLAQYLVDAGLPKGVCNILAGDGAIVGQTIIDSHDVDMVAFTGSSRVGKMAIKASAGNIKKLSLELGGKSPSVVFADCDIDAAIDGVLKAANVNMGECCIAGSRLLIQDSIADAFQAKLAARLKDLKMGDPFDPTSRIGAIINDRQYAQISSYVDIAVKEGATMVCGGDQDAYDGLFFPPTIIADVRPEMRVAREEIFGPVLVMMTFQDRDEAIKLANATDYGLAAYVWTQDLANALYCTRHIKAGRVWVNSALDGFPEMPLGGFKQSGNGRETGRYGIEEYTELKSVHLQMGTQKERWVTDV
ncbi:5-carboxymethyl-2-hydroxymuconic semialdehyde dehydrogenase (plasmid) [Octadecabacter arcticus 238]|uniref:5-carboxymethyl-2-hydroxymuconic semialdehyde dehydrogenase n=1 Tax=Octadecabacter arcticus 238 TaxID=391616 RepID=M9RRY5_9RHOB|nr:aldehyde dehydrogenase family protein [Octadecabacter arcticus]AGI74917.1 5-carboxymethyl-2-hydroxymuconic semialdehyde dehydrogenase [Octadecabacter arcticus 238]